MRNYMFTIEYNGKNYVGWQRQKDLPSIQEKIEEALSSLVGHEVSLTGSGRTDSGVHAIGQVASCMLETTIPADKLPFAINAILPLDVRITDCREVVDEFNARYSAKRKTYLYKIYTSRHISPLRDDTHMRVSVPLDIDSMQKACDYLIGEHDFRCFLASGSQVKDTVRTIHSARVYQVGDDEIHFEIEGNGFLYNMVRIIVGTLVAIGSHKYPPSYMEEVVESRDRSKASPTAPAHALYLKSVEYPNNIYLD